MDIPGTPKQSRLLSRLLGRLRGERSTMAKNILSFSSTGTSASVGCGSAHDEVESSSCLPQSQSQSHHARAHLAANIDMRYSGQYLTPEQLPEFCKQLSLLVDVIRNIQSYGMVVGEYPRELERQLEKEASEVAALASEARYARDTIARMQLQRRALKMQRSQINMHLKKLRESVSRQTWNKNISTDSVGMVEKSVQVCLKPKFRSKAVQTRIFNTNTSLHSKHSTINISTSPLRINRSHCNKEPSIKEIRELETSVRISDRKLFRSWESVKDSKNPEAYENLLDEVKNKQKTLSCMLQLIENRQALLSREQRKNEAEDDVVVSLPTGKHQATRRGLKRKKRAHESRSDHKTQITPKQVTLYITGSSTVDETESTRSSFELPSLELPQGPTPNIMFFTTNLT